MSDLRREAWFLHESNLIESVTALSRDDLWLALLADVAEGHAGAFLAFMRLAEEGRFLKKQDLFDAHRKILLEQLELESDWTPQDGLPPDIAPEVGGWRLRAVFIGGRTPPSYGLVPAVMGNFFLDLKEFPAARDRPTLWLEREKIIDFVADMHHRYERIHPFIDGNGRTGRLIANYMLAFYGLPIAIFTSGDRTTSYYPACSHETPEIMRAYLRLKMTRPDIALSVADFKDWHSYLED